MKIFCQTFLHQINCDLIFNTSSLLSIIVLSTILLAFPGTAFSSEDGFPNLEVTLTDGNFETGQLIYASDSLILLWQSDKKFYTTEIMNHATCLNVTKIYSIIVVKKNQIGSGFIKGFLIGAGIGIITGFSDGDDEPGTIMGSTAGQKAVGIGAIFGVGAGIIGTAIGGLKGIDDEYTIGGNLDLYRTIEPKLDSIALYPSNPPEKVQQLIAEYKNSEISIQSIEKYPIKDQNKVEANNIQTETSSSNEEAIINTNKSLKSHSFRRFHLYTGLGTSWSPANDEIDKIFRYSGLGGSETGWFGATHYPYDYSDFFAFDVSIEYSLTNKFRLGLGYNPLIKQAIRGRNQVSEWTEGESYVLCAEYLFEPLNPMFAKGWEFSLGGGIFQNSLSIKGEFINSYRDRMPNSHFETNKDLLGMVIKGTLDNYYYYRNISIQCKLETRIIPSIEVPEQSHQKSQSEYLIIRSHSLNLSTTDICIGLRWHYKTGTIKTPTALTKSAFMKI